ncbi:hypothetical protein [Streptomyces camponoticapitis]|nr:hypothetical protein [Streptomyces camponoticapitis]
MGVCAWGVHRDLDSVLAAVSHPVYEAGQLLDVADCEAAVRQ